MPSGASGIQIPGFNAPVFDSKVKVKLQEQKKLDGDFLFKMGERREATKFARQDVKIPPILRGYSGKYMAGRQIGAPDSSEDCKPYLIFQ